MFSGAVLVVCAGCLAQLEPLVQFGGIGIHRSAGPARDSMDGKSPIPSPAFDGPVGLVEISRNLFPPHQSGRLSGIFTARRVIGARKRHGVDLQFRACPDLSLFGTTSHLAISWFSCMMLLQEAAEPSLERPPLQDSVIRLQGFAQEQGRRVPVRSARLSQPEKEDRL